MGVEVLSSEFIEFENVSVAPSKGNLLCTVDPTDVPFEFGMVYNRDSFYPEQIASLGEPYVLRDHGIVVEVNAIQYNPIRKTLRVYTSVTVEVRSIGPSDINVLVPRTGRSQLWLRF